MVAAGISSRILSAVLAHLQVQVASLRGGDGAESARPAEDSKKSSEGNAVLSSTQTATSNWAPTLSLKMGHSAFAGLTPRCVERLRSGHK